MRSYCLVILSIGSVWAGEFVDLFNGKDFEDWGGKGKTEHLGYGVVDGTIRATKECRFLQSEKAYVNYILKFEFQLTPGANNGLGIHYPGSGDAAWTGLELQILDNTHPKYANLKADQFHGSLYSLVAAKRGHLKAVGEWNEQTVTVMGSELRVELNGVVIMEADLDEVGEQYPDHQGVKRRRGRIVFCGHGDVISFREIKIKELPAS